MQTSDVSCTMEMICLLGFLIIFGTVHRARANGISKEQLEIAVMYHVEDYPECKPSVCPKPKSKRWRKLQPLCCPDDTEVFHCQSDKDNQVYTMCTNLVLCPPGKFVSFTGDGDVAQLFAVGQGSICATCPFDQFQPTANFSYEFLRPECQYKRTVCGDFNAKTVSHGNAAFDDQCMCDLSRGYRPAPDAKGDCRKPFTASSGCMCEELKCPTGQGIHPETLQCINDPWKNNKFIDWYIDHLRNIPGSLKGSVEMLIAHIEENRGRVNFLASVQKILVRFQVLQKYAPHDNDLQTDTGDSWYVKGPVIYLTMTVVSLCVCFKWYIQKKVCANQDPSERMQLLIRVSCKSKKAADSLHKNVKNILPMLARHYGLLRLAYDSQSRYFTIVVHPKTENPFRLLHFLRDLLSSKAIKKEISECSMVPGNDVHIFVWHGRFPDAAEAHLNTTQPANVSAVGCDSGEIVFKFSNVDEPYLLKKLRSAKESLRELFAKYELDYKNVRTGSIIFRFHLSNSSRTFNEVATDTRMRELAKDLASHEAFRNLPTGQDVRVEMFCKARLDNVSIIQAENINMQIGEKNNVYLCEQGPNSSCDHARAERLDDVFVTEETGAQAAVGEMLRVNTMKLTFQQNATASQQPGPDEGLVQANDQNKLILITIRCHTGKVSDMLRNQWQNALPILKNHHTVCKMDCSGRKRIYWTLQVRDNQAEKTAMDFLADIFSIESVKYLAMEQAPRVDVYFPRCTKGRLSWRERGMLLFWRWVETMLVRFSFATAISFSVTVFWGLVSVLVVGSVAFIVMF